MSDLFGLSLGLVAFVFALFTFISDAVARKTKHMRRDLNNLSAKLHKAEERLADLEFERDFPRGPGDGGLTPNPEHRGPSLLRDTHINTKDIDEEFHHIMHWALKTGDVIAELVKSNNELDGAVNYLRKDLRLVSVSNEETRLLYENAVANRILSQRKKQNAKRKSK